MLKLRIYGSVLKFLESVERKHAGQITLKMLSLLADPEPNDSVPVLGTDPPLLRVDIGEYRIVYRVDGDCLDVPVIGRRNDDDVYKEVKRKGF